MRVAELRLLVHKGSEIGGRRANVSYSDIRTFVEYCPSGSIDAVVIESSQCSLR